MIDINGTRKQMQLWIDEKSELEKAIEIITQTHPEKDISSLHAKVETLTSRINYCQNALQNEYDLLDAARHARDQFLMLKEGKEIDCDDAYNIINNAIQKYNQK